MCSGKLQFDGKPLRELLIDAIRYGESPEVRARLTEAIARSALTANSSRICWKIVRSRMMRWTPAGCRRVREDMERAEAKRLQPHYIESFFLEAFQQLGGSAKQREQRRYEVTHVPAPVRNRDRLVGVGAARATALRAYRV